MLFGIASALAAAGFAAAGLLLAMPWSLPAWWTAIACLLASVAWLGGGPRVYGKRADGRRDAWSTLLLLPFLLPLWGWWHVRRVLTRELPWHTLDAELVIGRRLLDREFTLAVDHVVDLTCEYGERPRQRRHPGYVSMPIVDGGAPAPRELIAIVERLSRLRGRIYLHCAEGHGRTGLVAAALLLAKGAASDPDGALRRVRERRPRARPYRGQAAALATFWREWRTRS